jgi:phosphatidylglycerophosphatase C
MKPVIAAFDFDKTITTQDMLFSFLCELHSQPQNFLKSIKLLPVLCAYKTGLLNNHTAKQKLLTTFIENFSYADLNDKAENFAKTKIPLHINPLAVERIRWHQSQHHQCIVISAGLEIYLKPWAAGMGFDEVLATRLEVKNGITQGYIQGRNCFGQEKVNRLLEIAGPKENFILYAYGDSRGDRELLAIADYGFYRHIPNENLR